MGTDSKRRLSAAILISILIFMTLAPAQSSGVLDTKRDLNVGPYVDRIVYRIIVGQDQQVSSLILGSSELLSSPISSSNLPQMEIDPDISLSKTYRNGYGHITINCEKYPFNISDFRRAFAHAFDKRQVASDLSPSGLVCQAHDSIVPSTSSWCIEDRLRYHYYDADIATGNAMLDKAGFDVDDVSGFRLAPDGSPFNVSIEWTDETTLAANVSTVVTQAAVAALTALGINAASGPVWSHLDNLTDRIDSNQDFDMAFYAYNFIDTDVDWLGYHFWGEMADVPYANPCNYRNAEFDSWRAKLLRSTNDNEVYRAAAVMQRILHETVPMVVVYENFSTLGFRNDVYTGHIEDPLRGILSPWNLRNMHRIDGTPNGTVTVAIDGPPNTFNIFLDANNAASQIMAQLWPSLFLEGPDLKPVPYLAKEMRIETQSDNPSIPLHRTRFTIDIVENANWTDGTPLTAEDVVYSLKYAFESRVYGNPAGDSLTNLVAAYAPSPYRAVIEFKSRSSWHFSDFAYKYIIPKHIFETIGYSGWDSWNPVFNLTHALVTAGPFEFVQYLIDEFVDIRVNSGFWYHPMKVGPLPPDGSVLALIIGAGIAVIVILAVLKKKGAF
ncbi:MAG: ABC transporter substrate-binding protein [Candidatus Thorarchaeota archaeon]